MKKHPGFKAVQASIAKKEGVSPKAAGAILASKTRKASPAAKKANPRLNKVKGMDAEDRLDGGRDEATENKKKVTRIKNPTAYK